MSASALALATCLVVGIADGDTLTALCQGNQKVKVRLAEIDAPERKQPYGQRSRQSLAEICFQKRAVVQEQSKDRYQRTLARVTCDGVDANAEQVRRGMAWVYDQYAKDKKLYAIQKDAQLAKRGLWAEKNPVPPWEWRKRMKQKNA